jgi:hypothetical protein
MSGAGGKAWKPTPAIMPDNDPISALGLTWHVGHDITSSRGTDSNVTWIRQSTVARCRCG